jgi:hypothetical protein
MSGRRRYRGTTMALFAMFIATVVVPLLGATVDISRVWLQKAKLANAVEAACAAYANTPDLDVFTEGGGAILGTKARAQGYRLFGYNMPEGGALTSMGFAAKQESSTMIVTATCVGTAEIRPMIFVGMASFVMRKSVTVKAKYATATNW